MLHVMADVSTLCATSQTGVGTYVRELYRAISQNHEVRLNFVYSLSRLKNKSFRFIPSIGQQKTSPRWPFLSDMMAAKATVYHGPDFKIPFGVLGPKVVTIHDLACYREDFMANHFAQKVRRNIENSLKRAPDAIIVSTAFVASEVSERFPAVANRVFVTPFGSEHLMSQSTEARFQMPWPFFLVVGHVEIRKNLLNTVKAFEIFCEKNLEHRLVIVGKKGFRGQEILDEISKSPCKDRIILRDFIAPTELISLYKMATALLFVSYYEGFGFPALEAMNFGCPVIVSSGGALQEITGESSLKANPFEIDSICDKMMTMVHDPKIVSHLREQGFKRVRDFSWNVCAQQTIDIYKTIT